jgi:hypothetical protein
MAVEGSPISSQTVKIGGIAKMPEEWRKSFVGHPSAILLAIFAPRSFSTPTAR